MNSIMPVISQAPMKLLVVDDQPLNVRLLHALFEDDHDMFVATSGLQGIEVARKTTPDLVLMDVRMPGMDGYDACRMLKLDPATAHIPVIFVSAHRSEEDELAGFAAGGADFISKPFNATIVRARVKHQLLFKRQSDLLRRIADQDRLTGVGNRRFLEDRLASYGRQSARSGEMLALMMIDVDFFKPYNDMYGHAAGDTCLRAVAGALAQACVRPLDVLARYGGEDFVCLLPATSAAGAAEVAQRMHAQLRALALPHGGSAVGTCVTVSIGIACGYPANGEEAASLLELADRQLYRAKAEGRARTCIEAPEAALAPPCPAEAAG